MIYTLGRSATDLLDGVIHADQGIAHVGKAPTAPHGGRVGFCVKVYSCPQQSVIVCQHASIPRGIAISALPNKQADDPAVAYHILNQMAGLQHTQA